MPSLIEAIESKYSQSSDPKDQGPEDGSFIIVLPKAGRRDAVPHALVLDNCNVDSAGDEIRLSDLGINVKELDLSHNNISDWSEIEKILRQFPSATFINFSNNQLTGLLDPKSSLNLSHLRSLILIGTNIAWDSVWTLLSFVTNLEELHLSRNNYSTVDLPKHGQKTHTLSKLVFNFNLVESWDEVNKLGRVFPKLKHLSLCNCPIPAVPESSYQHFREVISLNIYNTLLANSKDITSLNGFPALSQIRVATGASLLQDKEKERRKELIALLPKIVKLNGGGTISAEEREAAERHFIRKYFNKECKNSDRYTELVKKHGKLEPFVDIKIVPTTMINLKIKFGDDKEVVQEVNLRQSVKDFKKFLEPIVGVEPSRMQLYFLDVGLNYGKDPLKFPEKQLYTYNMREGDEIHVQLKNKTKSDMA